MASAPPLYVVPVLVSQPASSLALRALFMVGHSLRIVTLVVPPTGTPFWPVTAAFQVKIVVPAHSVASILSSLPALTKEGRLQKEDGG